MPGTRILELPSLAARPPRVKVHPSCDAGARQLPFEGVARHLPDGRPTAVRRRRPQRVVQALAPDRAPCAARAQPGPQSREQPRLDD
eukprot:1290237-Prymnesium_polylepis.1